MFGSIASSDRTTLIDIEKEPIIYSYFRGRLDVMVWEIILGGKNSYWSGDEITSIPRHVSWANHEMMCELVKI